MPDFVWIRSQTCSNSLLENLFIFLLIVFKVTEFLSKSETTCAHFVGH